MKDFLLSVLFFTAAALTASDRPLYLRAVAGPLRFAAPQPSAEEGHLAVQTPRDGATVPLLAEEQKAFLAMPREKRIAFFADASKRRELARGGWAPQPVEFRWEETAPGQTYLLTISESADLRNGVTVAVREPHIALQNFKIATRYYWQVSAADATGKRRVSPRLSFVTEDIAPRLIAVDGVPNVRDLGGRIGKDGRRVKQGRIYRSAGLNFNAVPQPLPEEEIFAKRPELRRVHEETAGALKLLEEALTRQQGSGNFSGILPRDYTVFRPDRTELAAEEIAAFERLSAIPETFLGAPAERFAAGENGELSLPDHALRKPALLTARFSAPADGFLRLGCGADWYWRLAVNGVMMQDMLQIGNGKEGSPRDHLLEIPVRKGVNRLTVILLSGKKSWRWCCLEDTDPGHTRAEAVAAMSANLRAALRQRLLSAGCRYQPGKERLNDAMRRYLVENLLWRSDVDLRRDDECFGMTGSPVGAGVRWFHCSSGEYAAVQEDWGKKAFARVFRFLLDEKNHPVDFHCIGGQDRTGSLAFILNGLLGVDEEELYRDWEVSGFWNTAELFNHQRRFEPLVKSFAPYPGAALQEKIENYVLGLGFTPGEIGRFREMMLEPAPSR